MEKAIENISNAPPTESSISTIVGLFIFILILFIVIGWLYAIIDVLKSQFKDGSSKTAWLIALIFLPFTAIFYIFIAEGQKKGKKKK